MSPATTLPKLQAKKRAGQRTMVLTVAYMQSLIRIRKLREQQYINDVEECNTPQQHGIDTLPEQT